MKNHIDMIYVKRIMDYNDEVFKRISKYLDRNKGVK